MKAYEVESDNVVVDITRHDDENRSMVNVTVYLDGIIIEAYQPSVIDIKAEQDTVRHIMTVLGFTQQQTEVINGADYE